MSPWTSSFLAIAIVSGLPLLVTLAMAANEHRVERVLPYLTLFGTGTLIGAALLHLVPESVASGRSAIAIGLSMAGGYIAFSVIERLLAGHDHAHAHGMALGAPSAHESDTSASECVHLHPTPANSHEVAHNHARNTKRNIVPLAFIGDAVHNLVDGVLIAAAFLTQPGFGLLTAMAIALHELPREVGTFGLFVHGGIRPRRAVAYNAMTALISFAGAAITLAFGAGASSLGTYILPVAAGTYVYIAQAVARPSIREAASRTRQAVLVGWVAVGFSLMAVTAAMSTN